MRSAAVCAAASFFCAALTFCSPLRLATATCFSASAIAFFTRPSAFFSTPSSLLASWSRFFSAAVLALAISADAALPTWSSFWLTAWPTCCAASARLSAAWAISDFFGLRVAMGVFRVMG